MKLVSSDGGKYAKETFTDSIVLSPSERTTIDVQFGTPGKLSLQSVTPQTSYNLATFTVSHAPVDPDYRREFGLLKERADILAELGALDVSLKRAPDKSLRISLDMAMGGMDHSGHNMGMMHHTSGVEEKIEWEDGMRMMNASSTNNTVKWRLIDEQSGRENMDIKWTFKKGDRVKLRIKNDPNSMHPMQHPMHLHGQRFLILSTNGVVNENPAWKDTALVQTGDTVDLLVDMSNVGNWMIHCHIPEHMETGMMSHFVVTAS
jgi:FtsP/CotA-like multicopper oxidase with cupredoxin domain